MSENVYLQALIYLVAAVITVPLAKRFGLGSVLGYLLAGILIGPSGLRVVGSEHGVLEFAEFGVVMMLFLVGLELRPQMLWRLRAPILGTGGAQVGLTALVMMLIGLVAGVEWRAALCIGLILALSSTAIVLQSLAERNQLKLSGGQASFSVLLFQDVAVIPILALMPLLAPAGTADAKDHNLLSQLPGWLQPLATLGAVIAVFVIGRYFLRYLFRYVARAHVREIFTATALVLVIGTAQLMHAVGLSAALGTFLAGVVLSDSEYRHQLEADVEPFKGLLLGIFFIAVGSQIDFRLIAANPALVGLLLAGLIAVKMAILFFVGRFSGLEPKQSALFAFALAQGGEFCFVLLQFATVQQILPTETSNLLVGAVALSMAATPLLLIMNDRVVQPRLAAPRKQRKADEITEKDSPVILAGFGRFGHVVGRLLRSNGFGVTVLDSDPDQVDLLGRFGLKSFYGDATRLDLLHAAGARQAKLFICAIDDEEKALRLVKTVQREFPHLKIMARAASRQHAYELLRLGVDDVYRETFGSALDLGSAALTQLGMRANQAVRAAAIFKRYDEYSVRDMARLNDEIDEAYVSRARQHIENLERVFSTDRTTFPVHRDDAWERPLPEKPADAS